MSEIQCLVCKGTYFRKAYYNVEVKVQIDSYLESESDDTAYIFNDISSNADLDFRLKSEGDRWDTYSEVYKYCCEDCGFIMSFNKEKDVVSKKEYTKKKQKESAYDWTNFK